jgi:hypothetical protein
MAPAVGPASPFPARFHTARPSDVPVTPRVLPRLTKRSPLRRSTRMLAVRPASVRAATCSAECPARAKNRLVAQDARLDSALQRLRRLNPQAPSCGRNAGQHPGDDNAQGDDGDRDGPVRDLEYVRARLYASQQQTRERSADRDSRQELQESAPGDRRDESCGPGAERTSDADLARSFGHRKRHQSVEPGSREQDRDQGHDQRPEAAPDGEELRAPSFTSSQRPIVGRQRRRRQVATAEPTTFIAYRRRAADSDRPRARSRSKASSRSERMYDASGPRMRHSATRRRSVGSSGDLGGSLMIEGYPTL